MEPLHFDLTLGYSKGLQMRTNKRGAMLSCTCQGLQVGLLHG